jgi:hypothetical protein
MVVRILREPLRRVWLCVSVRSARSHVSASARMLACLNRGVAARRRAGIVVPHGHRPALLAVLAVAIVASLLGGPRGPATASSLSTVTWSQFNPPTSPSARFDAAMAFDPATGQLIL